MKPFITTYMGLKVNPLDLHPDEIWVEDIAHHLAIQNRFVGATANPISIAQHSVYVYRLVKGTAWEAEALFHDAPEAYLGDISKWVKQMKCMDGYRRREAHAWRVICKALHLKPRLPKIVKDADSLMVRYESLMQISRPEFLFELSTHPEPTKEEMNRIGSWHPWSWRKSEREFLECAVGLGYKV